MIAIQPWGELGHTRRKLQQHFNITDVENEKKTTLANMLKGKKNNLQIPAEVSLT